MKYYLIFLITLLMSFPMSAQNPDKADAQCRFFEAKTTEMCKRLRLTDEQKARFIPIYKAYDQDMRKAWVKYCVKKDSKDDVQRTKMRLMRQKKLQEIRLSYIDKFGKVLTDKQVEKFYKVESDIQRQAKHRREVHKHGKPKAGKDCHKAKAQQKCRQCL